MATKNYTTLIKEIIKLSESKVWEEARKEWSIDSGYRFRYKSCLCSKYPISEIIVIKNIINSNKTEVGNCCINRFFENKKYNRFFKALKEHRLNDLVIEIAYEKSLINDIEYGFLIKVHRKKNLTEKQINWLESLKTKILTKLS